MRRRTRRTRTEVYLLAASERAERPYAGHCLGGSPTKPRPWFDMRGPEPVEQYGRICDRTVRNTSRRFCASCPAYRGPDAWGQIATGMAWRSTTRDWEPYGLSHAEHERWIAAEEAALDDDFGPLADLRDRLTGAAPSMWQIRPYLGEGTEEWKEAWAGYMRAYRETHPADPDAERRYRQTWRSSESGRAARTAQQARRRARRRAEAVGPVDDNTGEVIREGDSQ